MKKQLLFLLLFHFILSGFAQQCNSLRYQDTIFHNVTVTSGIYFGTATPFGVLAQPQDLLFDFYEPTGDTLTKRPLIVFQFGGGFVIGWRSEPDIPAFCTYFAQLGYAVASIDYRIGLNPLDSNSGVRAYYRGVQDERSAIRFLSQSAQQYKIDTSLIILTGTSAGCFCAFANAFTSDSDRPAATYGIPLEPDDLGCMDCSGNTALGHHIPHVKAIVNQWGAILDTLYIKSWKNTPVISFHGDQDVLVPYTYGYPFQLPVFPPVYGSFPIHQRLDDVGILNVLHPLVGYSHEPELLAPQLNDTIYNYSRVFLYNLLKPHASDITGDSVVCENTIAHYSVISTPGSQYCWDITGNGTIVSNIGNAITVMWNDTGMVSVSVRELNYIAAEGDVKTFQTQVVAHAISNFNVTVNQLAVSFQNLSANADYFHWYFDDGTSSIDSTPSPKNYLSGGNYNITLIADNNYCADTSSRSITIDSCPVANITYQLINQNAFFYTPATNTLSYSWNFGDGDSAIINYPNVFHSYLQNGTYTVVLDVKNQLGCEATDTLIVKVAVTSINELAAGNVFVVMNDDKLTVYGLQFSSNKIYRATLYNMLGQEIVSNILSTYNLQLTTANCSPGVYLLKISDGENILVKKFIKE